MVKEAVGRLPMASEMNAGIVGEKTIVKAETSTIIPVGKSRPQVAETAGVEVAAVVDRVVIGAGTTVGTTVDLPARTIGPFRCQGTIESRGNSFRAATGPRASTLIGMRTFRSRPRALTCPTVLKM